jgi:hypothetical protein
MKAPFAGRRTPVPGRLTQSENENGPPKGGPFRFLTP